MRKLMGVVAAMTLAAGVSSLAAAASLVDSVGSAPQISNGVGAWGRAVSNTFTAIQADPALAAADSSAILGRVRLELALHPRSEPVLAFIPYLHLQSRSGFEAADFAALPLEQRARALDAAVAAAASDLQPRAEALAARAAEGDLSAEERAQIDAAAARWFYLAPETAAAVKAAAAKAHGDAARGLAQRIAASIPFQKTPEEKAVRAELKQVFEGAALIASENKTRPGADLVAARLAPYVARALDESEARVRERGVPEGALYTTLLKKQSLVFGGIADRSLFKDLRSQGKWTEFVAAVSLHAADRLQSMGEKAGFDLAFAAEGDDLRLPIPAWHPLFGRYPSIAHWLADVHGQAAEPADPKSVVLFTVAGTPVRAKWSFFPVFALTAYEIGKMSIHAHAGVGLFAGLVLGALTAFLLYGSLLAHEFGHLLVARAFGVRARRIVLNYLGGGAVLVRGARKALQGFLTSLAGPVVSVFAGAAFMMAAIAAGRSTLIGGSFFLLSEINILLAALNLLPLFPMDGGKIMRALFTGVFGSYRGTKIASAISFALSAALFIDGLKTAATNLPMGAIIAVTGALYAAASARMSGHPGTVTIDEKATSKS